MANNIEAIREDYGIGDPIRIVCSLGIKEGYIVEFSEKRIKIKPYEEGKKPISISDDNIEDFEEGTPPSFPPQPIADTDLSSAKEDISIDLEPVTSDIEVIPELSEEKILPKEDENGLEEQPVAKEIVPERDKKPIEEPNSLPSFVKGYLDPKDIDRFGGYRPAVHLNGPAKRLRPDQPKIEFSNDLVYLAKQYKSDDDNLREIHANGFITKFNIQEDKSSYGFIYDCQLKKEIYFSEDDLIDDQLYEMENLIGIQVCYIKIKGFKDVKAVGICYPRPVYQVLAMADSLQEEQETMQASYDLLDVVLSEYPDNESAKSLQSQIKHTVRKRQKHSNTTILDVASLKNSMSAPQKGTQLSSKTPERETIYDTEYRMAKSLINQKKPEEALSHYLKAFEGKKEEAIAKDIISLYCSFCGKKYIQKNPEKMELAEHYRQEGKRFLEEFSYLFPRPANSEFLSNQYYVLQEYEKYIEIIDEVIGVTKSLSQKVIFYNKKAVMLSALQRKDEALAVIEEALKIDPQNAYVLNLKSQIESNADVEEILADFEASDNPISPFLQDTIDKYNIFFGVNNNIRNDEEQLFSDKTYKDIANKIKDKNIRSDSQQRSQLLLTKIKIGLNLPIKSFDKRDLALYCNDMARITLSDPNKVQWDVARFYFIESFSLAAAVWEGVRRQFIQYIDTYIIPKRSEIFSINGMKVELLDNRAKEDLRVLILNCNEREYKWEEVLLHSSIQNTAISQMIVEVLYEDPKLRKEAVTIFKKLGKPNIDINSSLEDFSNQWEYLCYERKASQKSQQDTIKSKGTYSSLVTLNRSMKEFESHTSEPWLFSRDRELLSDIYRQLIRKIDLFIMAKAYMSKEDNYRDANVLLTNMIHSIKANPTKFTYEALLPLLQHYKNLLDNEWQNIILTSKPEVTISLQGQSVLIDKDNYVSFQIALSNSKTSSPISNIRLNIPNTDEVTPIFIKEEIENAQSQKESDNTHTDLVRGGDRLIFHIKVKVSDRVVSEKTTTVFVQGTYENSNDTVGKIEAELPLRLYSEDDYQDIVNPYNAGDEVTNEKMFKGRDADIDNYANIIMSSPTKQFIFYGQKRSGKSSVLYWLHKKLTEAGMFCVKFSMADIVRDTREVTFYHHILEKIEEALEDYDDAPEFEVPELSDFEKENPSNPVLPFKKYMKRFKKLCKSTPGWENRILVIMIDEFTYIYSKIKNGSIDSSIMMQWKGIIQDQDSSFAAVLVGQDVVPYFANEEYAKNAFQIMTKERLTYLKEEDALKLIVDPIRDENGDSRYATGAAELILDYTACSPYYIQKFCEALVDYMREKKAIIATTADVTHVARQMIQAALKDDFDNLISGGDKLEFAEINEKTILAVLYRIAYLTKNTDYCSRHDIDHYYKDNEGLIDGEEKVISKVLDNLEMREVVEINEGMYKIKVRLFHEWILSKLTPETASLKGLDQ